MGRPTCAWTSRIIVVVVCRCRSSRRERFYRDPARLSRRSRGVAGGRETAVEIEGGADERQVRERLGEVAEVLRLRAQLLTVQSQVIGVAEHLLEEEPR